MTEPTGEKTLIDAEVVGQAAHHEAKLKALRGNLKGKPVTLELKTDQKVLLSVENCIGCELRNLKSEKAIFCDGYKTIINRCLCADEYIRSFADMTMEQ